MTRDATCIHCGDTFQYCPDAFGSAPLIACEDCAPPPRRYLPHEVGSGDEDADFREACAAGDPAAIAYAEST